jgi:hypothetical protein
VTTFFFLFSLKSFGVYLSLCTPLFFLFDGRGSSCSSSSSCSGVDSSSAEDDMAWDWDGDGGDAISGSRQPRRFPSLRNFWPWRYKKKIIVNAVVKSIKQWKWNRVKRKSTASSHMHCNGLMVLKFEKKLAMAITNL